MYLTFLRSSKEARVAEAEGEGGERYQKRPERGCAKGRCRGRATCLEGQCTGGESSSGVSAQGLNPSLARFNSRGKQKMSFKGFLLAKIQ